MSLVSSRKSKQESVIAEQWAGGEWQDIRKESKVGQARN